MMSHPDFLHLLWLLPTYFFPFFEIKEITVLDSACANRQIRECFLASLAGSALPHVTCTEPAIEWLVQRRVFPGVVVIGNVMTEMDAILLSEVTSSVQEIRVQEGGYLSRSTVQILRVLCRFCPKLQQISHLEDRRFDLSTASFLKPRDCLLLADCCPFLTEVSFHSPTLTVAEFRTILCKCRNISIIDVRECLLLLTGNSLECVAELCPGLTSLTINLADRLDEAVLPSIASACPRLSSLRILESLRWEELEEDEEPVPVFPEGFSGFAQHCPACLHTLHLHYVHVACSDVLAIAARGSLRELSLHDVECAGAVVHWFQRLVVLCPLLQSVSLSQHVFGTLSAEDVPALANHYRHLTHIDLKGISVADETIAILTAKCTALQSLELHPGVMEESAILISIALHCPQLVTLDTGWRQVTCAAVGDLATQCSHLQSLTFACCDNFDFRVVAPLLCNLSYLHVPVLMGGDVATLAIVTHCTQLRSLSLGYDGGVCRDERIVRAIQRNCPHLRHLRISRCSPKVYAALLQHQRARALKKLDFEFRSSRNLPCWYYCCIGCM